MSRNLTEWLVELQGHKRRVAYIEWHPVAENVLFSAGFDHLVIVWDVNRCEAVSVIDRHPDVIYSMSLNRDGSLLATTCKDKKLRVFEPRSGIVVSVRKDRIHDCKRIYLILQVSDITFNALHNNREYRKYTMSISPKNCNLH